MPITEEQNDKIQENLEKQITDKVQKESLDTQDKTLEENPDPEKPAETEPYWAQKGFKSEADFVKSYEHAQSTIGKQASELGDLRKLKDETAQAKPDKQEQPKYTEYDAYDPDNVKWHQEKWAREAVEQREKEQAQLAQEQKQVEDRNTMIASFVSKHRDLSDAEMEDVAKFARDRRIYDLEDAYAVMKIQTQSDDTGTDGVKSQKSSISDLPQTLKDTGAGNDREVDAEDISNDDWGNLPKADRMKRLRAVS